MSALAAGSRIWSLRFSDPASPFIDTLASRFDALSSRVKAINREARRGIAATAALASPPTPSARGRTTVSVNTSFYRGETGFSVGAAHRLNLRMPVVISAGYANGGGAEHVSRVGVAFEF